MSLLICRQNFEQPHPSMYNTDKHLTSKEKSLMEIAILIPQ